MKNLGELLRSLSIQMDKVEESRKKVNGTYFDIEVLEKSNENPFSIDSMDVDYGITAQFSEPEYNTLVDFWACLECDTETKYKRIEGFLEDEAIADTVQGLIDLYQMNLVNISQKESELLKNKEEFQGQLEKTDGIMDELSEGKIGFSYVVADENRFVNIEYNMEIRRRIDLFSFDFLTSMRKKGYSEQVSIIDGTDVTGWTTVNPEEVRGSNFRSMDFLFDNKEDRIRIDFGKTSRYTRITTYLDLLLERESIKYMPAMETIFELYGTSQN